MARLAMLPSDIDDSDERADERDSERWPTSDLTDLTEPHDIFSSAAGGDEESTTRDYAVRCPECNAEFVPGRARAGPPESGVRFNGPDTRWATPVEQAVRYATSVAERTPLASLPELFLRSTARVLVVVDERRRPLGIVTPTSVISAVSSRTPDEIGGTNALDISDSGGAFLPERSTLRTAARRFAIEDREFLIVISEDGRLAGLVTPADVISALVDGGTTDE